MKRDTFTFSPSLNSSVYLFSLLCPCCASWSAASSCISLSLSHTQVFPRISVGFAQSDKHAKIRIINFCKKWITDFFWDFEGDDELLSDFGEFLESVCAEFKAFLYVLQNFKKKR